MKFLDQCKIYIQSGDGGAGCVSFRREKFIEFGGPDGGNGGRGGNVIFRSVNHLNTLIDFRYRQHFKASKGDHGSGKNRTGAKGEDLVVVVPTGTQIFAEDQETLLFDFSQEGQEICLAKAGDGGFGNAHFVSSTNQAPKRSTPGWPGEFFWLWLRLKLIADLGIIGLPNAGKSTLLSCLSRANPKIANYPFTTLYPNLGVVRQFDQEFILADLPGLCEGAHQGVGLGIRFLGHAERCAGLVHLLDITSDTLQKDYEIVRAELSAYDHGLADKPFTVILNKIDALCDEEIEEKQTLLQSILPKDQSIMLISAVSGQGLEALRQKLYAMIAQNKMGQSKDEIG